MSTFTGTQEITVCQGEVIYSANKKANSVTAVFKKVSPAPEVCASCPLHALCTQLIGTPPKAKKEKRIAVTAFTGMPIGELLVTHETKTSIEVVTRKNILLKFDKKTGLQLNAKDARFANRIAPEEIKEV